MRKEFPVNIESEEEWIDLPQGTHIHPKEVEKMFDDEEMGVEGREYGANILPSGKIMTENYGTHSHVQLPEPYGNTKELINTHSHPNILFEGDDKNAVVSDPTLSSTDLNSLNREMRVFSQTADDSSSGRIHSFKISDKGTKKDIKERKNMGNYLDIMQKKITNKHHYKPEPTIKTMKDYYAPMVINRVTDAEFNLARNNNPGGQTSVIKVRKSEDPKKVYITGIRSTHKDEPQYDLLQTLPRKKKPVKPLINRLNLTTSIKATGFGLVNLNLNGLSSMLVGSKKKKPVKKKGGKHA